MRPRPTYLLLLFGSLFLLLSCSKDLHLADSLKEEGEDHQEINLDEGYSLTQEQIVNAQIETTTAGPRLLISTMRLPAIAGPDLDEQSHVNAVLPGVVVKIQASLGEEVEVGDQMCTIRSATLAEAIANLHRNRHILVATENLLAREGDLLDRGASIAQEALDREEELSKNGFGTARMLAGAKASLQKAELAKDRRMMELQQRLEIDRIAVLAAEERIAAWGFDLSIADRGEDATGTYTLHAGASGVVLERHVTIGEFVDAETKLFLVQGMEEVWMLANAFENQLRFLDEGAAATVRFDAFPNMTIDGVVDHIHHDLDTETRTVKARVKVRNRPLAERREPHPLLPGMFGSIEIAIAEVQAEVVVPAAALLEEDGKEFLFTLEDSVVQRHFVETGMQTAQGVEILHGLAPGAHVVTEGVFLLKSMMHMDSIGDHDH